MSEQTTHLGLGVGDLIAHPEANFPGEWTVTHAASGFVTATQVGSDRVNTFGHQKLRLLRKADGSAAAHLPVPAPKDVPNCRDRTCSGAVYERSQVATLAARLADARGECAGLERRLVEIRDEAAIEIAWLKRELQRNDPRLYKARYERSTPTGGAER